MSKQFTDVSCKYGAPMGRPQAFWGADKPARCFHVRLSEGYDDGGAYWGYPNDVYCAMNADGLFLTVRASSRKEAKELFQKTVEGVLGHGLKWVN